MKTFALAAALAVGTTGVACADTPGTDWMTKDQVARRLRGLGYTNIRKLEADDDHWEGDATKDGKVYEIHVDPHSGVLTKNELKDEDD